MEEEEEEVGYSYYHKENSYYTADYAVAVVVAAVEVNLVVVHTVDRLAAVKSVNAVVVVANDENVLDYSFDNTLVDLNLLTVHRPVVGYFEVDIDEMWNQEVETIELTLVITVLEVVIDEVVDFENLNVNRPVS